MPVAPPSLLMPLLSDWSPSSDVSAQKVGHMSCMPIQGVLAKAEALHTADANADSHQRLQCVHSRPLVVQATKDVLAMASLEVDLSKIEPGNTITVKWRGKPVFVRRRTEAEIAKANETPMSELRDPETDDQRAQKPEVNPTKH